MKTDFHSTSRFFQVRTTIAAVLLLASTVLALSAFTDWRFSRARSGSATSSTTSIILNTRLGHSFWNELMTSITRDLPAFGQNRTTKHAFAI